MTQAPLPAKPPPALHARRLSQLSNALLILGLLGLFITLSLRREGITRITADPLAPVSADRTALWLAGDAHVPALFETSDADLQIQPSLCFEGASRATLETRLEGVTALLAREKNGKREALERTPLLDDEHPIIQRGDALCVDLPATLINADGEGAQHTLVLTRASSRDADADDDVWFTARSIHLEVVEARPLAWYERALSLLLILAMLLRVFSWSASPRAPSARGEWSARDPALGVLLFIAALVSLGAISPVALLHGMGVTLPLALELLINGLTFLALHVALSFGLTRHHKDGARDALTLHAPTRRPISLGAALGAGVILAILANVILYFGGTPEQTSQIQEITRMPGTRLALASMACLSPWYEELFFRGYLFGALERRRGVWIAGGVSAALFLLIHIPQHSGYLIPVIPIFLVAIATSAIRGYSGATTPSFALHLGYNSLLVIPTLFML